MTHVIPRYGVPLQILSDRGTEFESELFSNLMQWMGIEKLRTTVFKPSTNGIVERFHRTLNSMLGKVVSESQRNWDDKLPHVMSAYRSTVHSSTGYTPNKLFLGRESRMPVDLAMGLPPEESRVGETYDDYVSNMQETVERSYRLVREHLQTNSQRRKAAYDTRVRKMEFQVGTWVWYYYPRRYSRKSPKWQKNFVGPFLIVRQLPPVNYVLQKSKFAKPFTVHADKLKMCYSDTPASWIDGDSENADAIGNSREPCARGTPVSADSSQRLSEQPVPGLSVDRAADREVAIPPVSQSAVGRPRPMNRRPRRRNFTPTRSFETRERRAPVAPRYLSEYVW